MVKLEEGKYYRTRDGRKVGPLVMHPNYSLCGAEGWSYSMDSYWYTDKEYAGRTQKSQENEEDLVAEWVEETTMDIYSLEKPLGMYPYEIRDALYAHTESGGKVQSWGGWGWALCEEPAFNPNLTYRAVKKPEVIEVVMYTKSPTASYWGHTADPDPVGRTHKITFNLVDGVPDCNSIKMVALSDQSKPSF